MKQKIVKNLILMIDVSLDPSIMISFVEQIFRK